MSVWLWIGAAALVLGALLFFIDYARGCPDLVSMLGGILLALGGGVGLTLIALHRVEERPAALRPTAAQATPARARTSIPPVTRRERRHRPRTTTPMSQLPPAPPRTPAASHTITCPSCGETWRAGSSGRGVTIRLECEGCSVKFATTGRNATTSARPFTDTPH